MIGKVYVILLLKVRAVVGHQRIVLRLHVHIHNIGDSEVTYPL